MINGSPITAINATHLSVLKNEVINNIYVSPTGKYFDGTLGLGGHSLALLEKSNGQAFLCGVDRDFQALERAKKRLEPYKKQCKLFLAEYSDVDTILDSIGWNTINGAMLDIGVSSLQLDVQDRGFSYNSDAPLDMRMDSGLLESKKTNQWFESAYTLVNQADLKTLKRIIETYGEDPLAAKIALAIINKRKEAPIETTCQLADIIYHAYPVTWRNNAKKHPATRTFQAIRIAVNDELGQLERFLDKILQRLELGGRLAIITFHSLEDRIVKQKFQLWSSDCICPPHLPKCVCGHKAQVRLINKKPILPSREEIMNNPRASSAKLRVVEKIYQSEDN